MCGRLSAVKNASQSVIFRGYLKATCLNAGICFSYSAYFQKFDFSFGTPS